MSDKPREFEVYVNCTTTGDWTPKTFVNGTQDITDKDIQIKVIEKSAYDKLQDAYDMQCKVSESYKTKADKLAEALTGIAVLKKDGLTAGLVDVIADKALAEYRGEKNE